jgi:ribosomal protein L37AE/L43A
VSHVCVDECHHPEGRNRGRLLPVPVVRRDLEHCPLRLAWASANVTEHTARSVVDETIMNAQRDRRDEREQRPAFCPYCHSKAVGTHAKVITASTFWHCQACGQGWTVAPQATGRRPFGSSF